METEKDGDESEKAAMLRSTIAKQEELRELSLPFVNVQTGEPMLSNSERVKKSP